MCRETTFWASSPSLVSQYAVEDVYEIRRVFTLTLSGARQFLLRASRCVPPVPIANCFVDYWIIYERRKVKNDLPW